MVTMQPGDQAGVTHTVTVKRGWSGLLTQAELLRSNVQYCTFSALMQIDDIPDGTFKRTELCNATAF